MGFRKKVTWKWDFHVELWGQPEIETCTDDNNDGDTDDPGECVTTLDPSEQIIDFDYSEDKFRWTPIMYNTPLSEGQPAGNYAQWLKDEVQDRNYMPLFTPATPTPLDLGCFSGYQNCSQTASHSLTVEREKTPEARSPYTEGTNVPAFWTMFENWGTHVETLRQDQDEGVINDLTTVKKQGVKWLDLTQDPAATPQKLYSMSYFNCQIARNGGTLWAWKVGVPFPRYPGANRDLSDYTDAIVGAPIEPPEPQSLPGLKNEISESSQWNAQQAIPVHIPVPLYDIGSGASAGTTASPDGNWWATVGSIPDEADCAQMGFVPVCLAQTARPWRAIWYIEPPPTNPLAAFDPTPRDVRVCGYSTSSLSFLNDTPREIDTAASHYQVDADTRIGDRGSMMHRLDRARTGTATTAIRTWLQKWLYGTGTVQSRHRGQDQQNPDRYCWYQWNQAQNRDDGFEGIMSVEWLTAFYIGVPEGPRPYCALGGVQWGAAAVPTQDTPHDPDDYNCSVNLNFDPAVGIDWFEMAAADWNDPSPVSPSVYVEWLERPVNDVSTCYMGVRQIQGMNRPFHW